MELFACLVISVLAGVGIALSVKMGKTEIAQRKKLTEMCEKIIKKMEEY